VRRFLPALSDHIVLRVEAGHKVINETGETGSVFAPNVVYWTVDPRRSGGVMKIVEAQLRPTLFHEFHHLVRGTTINASSLMDRVITEGMATVFERDLAGAPVPWGDYPADVSRWVDELLALSPDARVDDWMFRHPDGRRWIGFKAGTYLVDRAARISGRSAAELVSTPTEEVIRIALTK
jgi:uncharacterized protein YjaZ